MHRRDGRLIVSATDLVGFLVCGHLTHLERAAADGHVAKPRRDDDPEVELLRRRGGRHEERFLQQLLDEGHTVTDLRHERIDGEPGPSYAQREAETLQAMRRGDDVIFQATVFDGRWVGHPDFLIRVGEPGLLGVSHHYEVADTKLAHSAKASALVQICSYVEQVTRLQSVQPEHVHVVTSGATITKHSFRTAELMAYYRRARAAFEGALADPAPPVYPVPRERSYPDPVEHCQVCRWFYEHCRQQWRDDDALPQVASISRRQRQLLAGNSVATMTALAELTDPIALEGVRTQQLDALRKVRDQARLQVRSKGRAVPEYELIEPPPGIDGGPPANHGLSLLPPPSEHDLFFDIEGDPFAFWEGLDYLFGVWAPAGSGAGWHRFWALDREAEKRALEELIDFFVARRSAHPDLHVYHYGSYEPGRLKRLAGRHATREAEVSELLRQHVLVDLLQVVRQGVRVGTEGYSIKDLEPLYGFEREVDLRTAGKSIVEFELWLDKKEREGTSDDALLERIERYNRDDCVSTERLRDWLEQRRPELQARLGRAVPRLRVDAPPQRDQTAWEERLAAAIERLTAAIPADLAAQDDADRATWLLANMLDFHRREDKASWWRFFELLTLTDDELYEAEEPIARLTHVGEVGRTRTGKQIHRYRFPPQEHRVGDRSDLHDPRLPPFGEGDLGTGDVDKDALTLELTLAEDWQGPHPRAVVPIDRIPIEGLQNGLMRFADWVAESGIDAAGETYQAGRDLLRRRVPRIAGHSRGQPLVRTGETGSEAARRLATRLDGTTLAIQGPPGSGKTYTGARMILDLVRDGRRVGVTGSSHKVITNLLEEVAAAGRLEGVEPRIVQRIDGEDGEPRAWPTAKDSKKLDKLLADPESDFRVIGGTVWLWARDEMSGSVDTLFVDEAGQVALANVIASAGAARNIVLLGDPRQLDQVLQGAHPPGAEKSALDHFLGDAETVPAASGIFLESTWRMHPRITRFTSELFYEGKLESVAGLDSQRIAGDDWLAGSGVRWVPVEHDANTNASVEEAQRVAEIARALVGRQWIDRRGNARPLELADIVIVSPFNAHRLLVQGMLEGARVGTVDKFQGQEAPVSIYTMATSRPEDAPRGVDFLYSLNRLNVATSRARALAIVVASPGLLAAVPHTPHQLRMINGLCAFVEAASSDAVTEPQASGAAP